MTKPQAWLVHLYSSAVNLLWNALKIPFLFLPTPRQFLDRELSPQDHALLRNFRSQHDRCVVWFCSSAGEYEQAKPIMDKLATDKRIWQVIIFFSRSGFEFAKVRQENLPFIMSPPDTLPRWRRLLGDLRPNICVIVRYELWPAFLAAAAETSVLMLVDASAPKQKTSVKAWLQKKLLAYFDWVAVVQPHDGEIFKHLYSGEISVTGDTKYERALQRAKQPPTDVRKKLDEFRTDKSILIGGSVWPADVKVIVAAYKQLSENVRQNWRVVLVPHDISDASLAHLESICAQAELTTQRWQQLNPAKPPDVLLIDVLGILAELYSAGNLGFVGGAMDHKVHNVLEPACHGLFLAHGPCYTTSIEAIELVEKHLSTVVRGKDDLAQWWAQTADMSRARNDKLLQHVQQNSGAVDKVFDKITSSLALKTKATN